MLTVVAEIIGYFVFNGYFAVDTALMYALNLAAYLRGCSSVGLERRPVTPKVAGSSPVTRAILLLLCSSKG